MPEEQPGAKARSDDSILQAQYLRALGSFEGIVLAQIQVMNQVSNRLNWSIRAGLILLGVIAFSILVLLLTLSSQINRISSVVVDINGHFDSITQRMDTVSAAMGSMEGRVALLGEMDSNAQVMDEQMSAMGRNMRGMATSVEAIRDELQQVRAQIVDISGTVGAMNRETAIMASDMHRMAKPARAMNRMFPIP